MVCVSDMEDNIYPFETVLEYAEVNKSVRDSEETIRDNDRLSRLQRIHAIKERQRSDLSELRTCIEYITRHTHVIQSALRSSEESSAVVPVCSSMLTDILAVKDNIQESIHNAHNIKLLLGKPYQPFMENLLSKMEIQLSNWSSVLSIASRTLVNSRALVDNIQNLIATQQQMCSEVVQSDLFSCLEAPESQRGQEPGQDMTVGSDLNTSIKCSTPILSNN